MWTVKRLLSTMGDMVRQSVLFLTALTVSSSFPALAQSRHEHCFQAVGAASGIHPPLLKAIAIVESSNNPGATNKQHVARTGSYDIGLMQINSRWLPTLARHGLKEDDLFEPCTSIEVGAWILVDLFRRHGGGWEAVGAYNAACSSLQGAACRAARDVYINKVRKAMSKLDATGSQELKDVEAVNLNSQPPSIQTLVFSN